MSPRRILITIILLLAAIVAKFSFWFGVALAATVAMISIALQVVRIRQRERKMILLCVRNAGGCLREVAVIAHNESVGEYKLLAMSTAMFAAIWLCLLPFAELIGITSAVIGVMGFGLALMCAPFIVLFSLAFFVAKLTSKIFSVARNVTTIRDHLNG